MRALSMQGERGFTLLEVLGAILIFAFGVLALSRTQIAAISTNSSANDLTEATRIAQSNIELLMNLPYNDASALRDLNGDSTGQDGNSNGIDNDDEGLSVDGVPAFGLNKTDANGQPADYTTTERNGRDTIFWNVALDRPVPQTKTIRTIVRWTGKNNVTRSVTMDAVHGSNY